MARMEYAECLLLTEHLVADPPRELTDSEISAVAGGLGMGSSSAGAKGQAVAEGQIIRGELVRDGVPRNV